MVLFSAPLLAFWLVILLFETVPKRSAHALSRVPTGKEAVMSFVGNTSVFGALR